MTHDIAKMNIHLIYCCPHPIAYTKLRPAPSALTWSLYLISDQASVAPAQTAWAGPRSVVSLASAESQTAGALSPRGWPRTLGGSGDAGQRWPQMGSYLGYYRNIFIRRCAVTTRMSGATILTSTLFRGNLNSCWGRLWCSLSAMSRLIRSFSSTSRFRRWKKENDTENKRKIWSLHWLILIFSHHFDHLQ